MYTINVTLPGFSVSYNGNGNTGGSVPTDSTVYSSGNTVTVLGNTGSLVKTGYTFNNWNTASNGSGTNYTGGNTFSITADTTLYAKWTANSPTVTTGSASSISIASAVLGGNIDGNGLATTASFEYGISTAYGSTASAGTVAAGVGSTPISATLSGLMCNTVYHFRAVGASAGGTVSGSDATFTTSACSPTATTGSATSVTAAGATLAGTVSSNGASTVVTFDYGLTTAYGSSASAAQSPLAAGTSGASVSAAISGLTCNATYHFRVKGVNSTGTTNGSDATFTTSSCAPSAVTGTASSVTATSATLAGTIADNGATTTVSFEYGLTTGYGSSGTASPASVSAGAGSTAITAAISGLTCNTLYHFRITGSNSVGTANGSDATFTTSACAPTAITGAASSITATGATLGGTISSNGATTTASFEYGLTTGYGSSANAAENPIASSSTGASVSATISGLTCNTLYHFRIKGVNTAGTTNGSDTTFTSGACPPTVTAVSPTSGSSLGGTTVVITGTGFTGASAVKFGGTNAASFTVNSATQITASSPSGAVGVVDITVTTVNGTSATAPSDQFTYDGKTFLGSLPGGGTATVVITGGGAACKFDNAQFVPVSAVTSPPPAGVTFKNGLFDYQLSGCTPGQPVTVAIIYPSTPGTLYWKFGPTIGNTTPHWYTMPGTAGASASIGGNVATLVITDGGDGDDDMNATNGTIVDPGGPGSPASSSIPTLSEWALILLTMLIFGTSYSAMSSNLRATRRR